ncbi:MAG: polysaccharide biosynthesis protein [Candidatus Obscuribacterales bacterium]|nr:polysaccharide biosynthesis protein [Candidatus Obscuribacterales bacterium]
MSSDDRNQQSSDKLPEDKPVQGAQVLEEKTSWIARVRWLRLLQVVMDAALVALGLLLAFLIRFDGSPSRIHWHQFLCMLPVFISLRLISNWICGVYTRLWRYTGLAEVIEIGVATLSITTILMIARAVGLLSIGHHQLSYGIILLEPILTFMLIVSARVARRLQTEHKQRRHWRQPVRKRALVVGAGDAGQMVAKELSLRLDLGTDVIGFVDDDPRKVGKRIGNATVYGTSAQLLKYISTLFVDQVIIAIPSAPPSEIRRIVDICREAEVETRILPGLFELIDGRVSINQLRTVSLEDLLGREKVQLDTASIAHYIEGKTVLVTGAGGSIGSELCRQIMSFQPKELLLLGRGENSIFTILEELKRRPEPVKLTSLIADIRDFQRMYNIFSKHKPQVVFHAAAHKHVPLMEGNVTEAIKNNIGGTRSLANLSAEFEVENFVLVSTDKAVNPTSVMGASKRVAELIVQDIARRSKTRFGAVRFGNVLDSRGSVIPTWRKQIELGGPVTVTHPDAVRYFMLIPEAVQLIIQAGALGAHGDIFVLDMGNPVKILDLANDLIRLSGLRPGQDIEIKFVGLRPGEKLYEELLTAEEGLTATRYKGIFVGKPQETDRELLERELKRLFESAETEDETSIRASLEKLVGGTLIKDLSQQ